MGSPKKFLQEAATLAYQALLWRQGFFFHHQSFFISLALIIEMIDPVLTFPFLLQLSLIKRYFGDKVSFSSSVLPSTLK